MWTWELGNPISSAASRLCRTICTEQFHVLECGIHTSGSGMRTSRILYVSLVFFFYMPYLTNRRPGFGAACSQIQGVEFQMDVLQEDAQSHPWLECWTRATIKVSPSALAAACGALWFRFEWISSFPVAASMGFHKSIDGQILNRSA